MKFNKLRILIAASLKNELFLILIFPLFIFDLSFAQNQNFSCFGTEPFWKLDISKDQIMFEDPAKSTKKMSLKVIKPETAANRQADWLMVYRSQVLKSNKNVTIIIQRAPDQGCSDGMSDNVYPYSNILIFPDRILDGCCQLTQSGKK